MGRFTAEGSQQQLCQVVFYDFLLVKGHFLPTTAVAQWQTGRNFRVHGGFYLPRDF